jgi:hypothetical protein
MYHNNVIPEGLMNNPVYLEQLIFHQVAVGVKRVQNMKETAI